MRSATRRASVTNTPSMTPQNTTAAATMPSTLDTRRGRNRSSPVGQEQEGPVEQPRQAEQEPEHDERDERHAQRLTLLTSGISIRRRTEFCHSEACHRKAVRPRCR
jgi:hypothetical protein